MIEASLKHVWNTLAGIIDPEGKNMESLNIGIKKKVSRRNDPGAGEADQEFDRKRRTIIIKSGSTCQYCKAPTTIAANAPQGFFEIHHKDDDHTNNDDKNLFFTCPFCHMVFACGKHGKDFEAPKDDSAHLLWLPSVPQNTLNLLAHIIFQIRCTAGRKDLARIKEHPACWINESAVQDATRMERAILDGGVENIANIFGRKKDGSTVQCFNFYDMLKNTNSQEYDNRLQVFSGIRLWPKQEKFAQMNEYLAKTGKLLKSIPMSVFTR